MNFNIRHGTFLKNYSQVKNEINLITTRKSAEKQKIFLSVRLKSLKPFAWLQSTSS